MDKLEIIWQNLTKVGPQLKFAFRVQLLLWWKCIMLWSRKRLQSAKLFKNVCIHFFYKNNFI